MKILKITIKNQLIIPSCEVSKALKLNSLKRLTELKDLGHDIYIINHIDLR